MLKLRERTQDNIELLRRTQDVWSVELRVAMPGIIQDVNYEKQTCTVQPAIRERLNFNGTPQWVDIPLLLDVPFFVPSGGNYYLTLPVQPGDDCLVIFNDSCIDAWWQSGGIQNQVERRRHDLSDAMAFVGFKSQPQKISNYSSASAQLRNKDGSACIEIKGGTVNISASTINISGKVTIAGGQTVIDGKNFLGHNHSRVTPGGGNTGGVS